MKRTRRQAKQQQQQAAAAAEAEPAAEPSASQAVSATGASIHVPIPDDVDVEFLSSLLPDVNLENPTPDDIISLYRLVSNQASELDATHREVEELKAEVERKDVELDQALQDRETSTKELESQLESSQNELRQVKHEKDELAAARAELESKLASLSSSQSASSSEVETLRRRVEDVEREKRNLVGVVSRLKEDSAQREEEIHTLRTNLKEARQEHQALESQVRELRSTDTANKFKLESLTQQLQLARDEVDRLSTDLTAKTEEFATYRRQKHAELAQLQAAHDSLAQTHSTTDNTLKALQSSHGTQSHQLAQAQARIQELRGQLAEQEATYSSEAAGLRRLVQMMEEREAQAKSIVENIEKEWAEVGDRAERREVVLREEIEAERQRAEAAEKKVADLQKVLERVDRGEFPLPGSVSQPGTPLRGPATPMRNGTPGGDFMTSGMMGLSPTVAIASRVQKSGKTFTEVYADYVKLQEEYAQKSQECEHLDRTLAAVLAQIEERAPLLAQQREEYERVHSEATYLADELKKAIDARDVLEKSFREAEQKLKQADRENEFLNKQLSDLGRQVQTLLRELGRGQDPSIPSDDIIEQITEPAQNIEAVITNNLVLFRSLPELQQQNQKLLKIVRELGAKMEAEEKEYKAELEKEQSEAIQEAHEAIKLLQQQLEHQKKSAEITIQAHVKEREALKQMLQKERSQKRINGVGEPGAGAPAPETSEELAEIQNQFEAYKAEIGVDTVRLREEVLVAQRETGQLGANLAKANAKNVYLNERNRMLQDQVQMQTKEIQNLQKRNQELYDQYTRIDIECNRVTEDLYATKSQAEQLRNESANLKAEKRIWESIQARLVEENRNLTLERSQLSDLMSGVQRMHTDLERSGENDRRRLESQIQMLETQTQDLRTQLSQERDSVRHLTLQKDLELKELHNRIDKASQELSNTREALARAETSKEHLEEQVGQLSKQLQGNQEKLAVYERRGPAAGDVTQRTEDLSREQQLEAEVAELRSALKVAEVDLAAARAHVQQFQEISQANEAALASLNATYDEYKSTTESQLAMRDSELHAKEEKLAAVQQELERLSEANTELQRALESERAAWMSDKKTLEGTIFELSTSEKTSESERAANEGAVRQQEERAKAAEEKYSREVVAHAESIKLVENLKTQLAQVQATVRDHMTAAETAQAKLATSEASWKQQKEALDKELADLNTRIKDLSAQNTLLHQHLESVTSQAARIRQAADTEAGTPGEVDTTGDADIKLQELRSVVSYLRKEKEIVELQLELSKQENIRLKTQIDHIAHTLEETQKALTEEREKAVEAAASEAQHAELVERIQQLNILRESNATLRADCEAHAKRARELEIKVQQLTTELEPVKQELRVTKAELEARNQQVKRLEEETRRWQERNTQLLTKYDRIDPAEVQALKEQIEQLTQAKEQLEKGASDRERALQTKVSELGRQINSNNQTFRRKLEATQNEKKSAEESLKQKELEIQTLTAERDALKTETVGAAAQQTREAELNRHILVLRKEKMALEKALADERAKPTAAPPSDEQAKIISQLTEERDKLLVEKASWAVPDSEEQRQQWQSEKAELVKSRDEALAQAQAARHHAEEMNRFKQNNADLRAKVDSLIKARSADRERALEEKRAAVSEAVEKVKQDSEAVAAAAPSISEDLAKQHAEELQALEEKLSKHYQEELAKAMDAAKQSQPDKPLDETQKDAIATAVAAREQALKVDIEKQIADAVERGRMEVLAKSKLKDSQLVRAQTRLKELEGKIAEWRQQGIIKDEETPSTTAVSPPAKTAAITPAAPPVTAEPPTPAPAKAAAAVPKPGPPARTIQAAAGATAGPSGLPKKPTAVHVTRSRGGAVRGAGRGHAPAVGLSIRGQAQAGEVQPAEPSTEMSIMGASKRTREEGEGAEDSLAKRLKPDGGRPSAAAPVTIRRDRVHPS